MTIIQPYKKVSIINVLILIFSILLVGSALLLVVLYNNVVNLEYKINSEKKEIKKIETEISEAKENLFNLLSAENLKKIANENGLIEEKNPEYFEINSKQWQIGLNF
ncbi:MAG: hypothetical protein ACP5QN_00905 [Minisyncoccia bacterium]